MDNKYTISLHKVSVRSKCFQNGAWRMHEIRFCWTKPSTQWDCFHNSHFMSFQWGDVHYFDISLFFFKNGFLTRFSGCRGKAEASRARGCKSCWERRGFEVSFAKTSKIIFIPFSITLSPCVFWSQHDSPLLLSPYNRWWRHTGGKSVLALARSNATMRKCLHFWGWSFSRGLYLADVMLRSSSAPPFFSFSFIQELQEYASDFLPHLFFCPRSFNKKKLKKLKRMCRFVHVACLEHCTATAETQRQECYCCLSRKKAD